MLVIDEAEQYSHELLRDRHATLGDQLDQLVLAEANGIAAPTEPNVIRVDDRRDEKRPFRASHLTVIVEPREVFENGLIPGVASHMPPVNRRREQGKSLAADPAIAVIHLAQTSAGSFPDTPMGRRALGAGPILACSA